MLRGVIRSQMYLSRRLDLLLPARFTIDGNTDFFRILEPMLTPGSVVWDIGGGKHPVVQPSIKKEKKLLVVGLDISAEELDAAPPGAYDEAVVADIGNYRGRGDADLVVCQALLEHVQNTAAAFAGISSILKTGGIAILFTPCRNAAYARLNLVLPQRLKQQLLFAIYQEARGQQGFLAHYDRCTPSHFRRLAADSGLQVNDQHLYYHSNYFNYAFPIHLLWRLWVLLFAALAPDSAAETFIMTLVKQ